MLGKQTPHPAPHELKAGAAAALPPARVREIESHLASCPECARRFERDRRLATALGLLTAAPRRGRDYRMALRDVLAAAAKRGARAALQRRLELWSRETDALAGGVVRWIPPERGANARGRVEWINTFTGTSPLRIESRAPRGAASGAGPADPCVFVQPEGPHALAVHVSHWPGQADAPLVLLARELGADAPLVKLTRRDAKKQTQCARFGSLKPGRYILALEPLPAPPDPP